MRWNGTRNKKDGTMIRDEGSLKLKSDDMKQKFKQTNKILPIKTKIIRNVLRIWYSRLEIYVEIIQLLTTCGPTYALEKFI